MEEGSAVKISVKVVSADKAVGIGCAGRCTVSLGRFQQLSMNKCVEKLNEENTAAKITIEKTSSSHPWIKIIAPAEGRYSVSILPSMSAFHMWIKKQGCKELDPSIIHHFHMWIRKQGCEELDPLHHPHVFRWIEHALIPKF